MPEQLHNGKKGMWPGEPVSKEVMMPYLKEKFSRGMLNGKILFALAYPGLFRAAEKLFTLRICRYDHIVKPIRLRAAFDGVLCEQEVREGDLLLGSYNSGNEVVDRQSAIYGGLSIIFHLHHIRLHYCHFDRNRPLANFYYHTPKPAEGVLLHLMKALDIIINESGPFREERCRSLLEAVGTQLYHELEKSLLQDDTQSHAVSRQIKGYLDHNFTCNINCSLVCEALGINRSYGSTVFHSDFGVSMANYLLKLRMDAARHLLSSEHKLKIEEISRFCAFQDTGYFIRVFRQETGMTPGEYRKKNNDVCISKSLPARR